MSRQQNSSKSNAGVPGDFALKDLYKLLEKELATDSLQAIDSDTFHKIAAGLGSLKGQGYEGIEARVRDRMVDLFGTSARLLIETRLYKIRTNFEPSDYSKLTDEEKYILDGRRESERRTSEVVAATIKGRVKALESISAKVRAKQIVVRFVKPMESFVGVDANKYGPFQPEDVASIPFENARSMLETGIAVELHIQI